MGAGVTAQWVELLLGVAINNIRVLVQVLVSDPAAWESTLWEAADDGSGWAPATHVGDPDGVPGS